MTEKRFTLGKDYDSDGNWEYCYQDEKTGRIFNFADDFCHTDFLELVNAVIDDLTQENKELKYKYDEQSNEKMGLEEDIDRLLEKNKELQERNDRQCKRLDNLYKLIEEKNWKALSDIMDDFKKYEELLQMEWSNFE